MFECANDINSLFTRLQKGILALVGIGAWKLPEIVLILAVARNIRIIGNYSGSLQHTKEVLNLLKRGKVSTHCNKMNWCITFDLTCLRGI